MMLTSHAVVAAIELAFYVLLLAPTLHNVFHFGLKEHKSWLFLAVFSCGTFFFFWNDLFLFFWVSMAIAWSCFSRRTLTSKWRTSRGLVDLAGYMYVSESISLSRK